MPLRPFGRTGLHAPVLGFGAMQIGDPAIDEAVAGRVLHAVLDAGVTLLDTARSYGVAEERIGRHLAQRRDEFVLSTKVGYGVPGIPDWTHECILRGVDAARERLRSEVIDVVHLHSCGLEILRDGAVVDALQQCVTEGKVRVAAYSGDDVALAEAVDDGRFGSVQASISLCDQQGLPTLRRARRAGVGAIAKRSLAGRPWVAGAPPADPVHGEYYRRFQALQRELALAPDDWDELALRFAAYEDGVDCVIVGGTDLRHLQRNLAAVARGPLPPAIREALVGAFAKLGSDWKGLV